MATERKQGQTTFFLGDRRREKTWSVPDFQPCTTIRLNEREIIARSERPRRPRHRWLARARAADCRSPRRDGRQDRHHGKKEGRARPGRIAPREAQNRG